jgi:hypothetical protein
VIAAPIPRGERSELTELSYKLDDIEKNSGSSAKQSRKEMRRGRDAAFGVELCSGKPPSFTECRLVAPDPLDMVTGLTANLSSHADLGAYVPGDPTGAVAACSMLVTLLFAEGDSERYLVHTRVIDGGCSNARKQGSSLRKHQRTG